MKKSPNQIRRLLMLFCLMLTLGSMNSFAQKVSGKITDESNQTMPGVTIRVEGNTELGTITNVDGAFVLDLPNAESDVIIVSFIGMETQTIPVAGRSEINVVLKESFTKLEEFVAIGYGVVRRKDITGAVASIKSEDLVQNPVANVSEALQGKLAGVAVSSQDGRPGADVTIRIRGGGSITQSNDPLVVVDGITGYRLSDIPADQIESVDVLKDAASTAIYGARGANGVILVTTKGLNLAAGKTKVSYSGYHQSKQVSKRLDVLNPQEYLLHQWSYATAYGGSAADAIASYYGLGSAYGNHYSEYAGTPIHNYTDDLLRDAIAQSHNLSISSSTEKTNIAFNANMTDDQGLKIKSGYNRYNLALKLEHELYKGIKVGFDVKYVQSTTEGRESLTNGAGSILSSAYRFMPIDNPLGHGDLTQAVGIGNGDVNLDETFDPYLKTMRIDDISDRESMHGVAYINWNVMNGLTFRSEIGGSRTNSESQYYFAGISDNDKEARLTLNRGSGYRSTSTINYEVQGLVDHKLSVLLGNDVSVSQTNSTRIYGKGYPESFDFETTMAKMQFAKLYEVVSVKDPLDPETEIASIHEINKDNFDFYNNIGVASTTVSFFGRLNYSYKDRYLFTATMRSDASSKFAPNNNRANFPSSAFAWRASEEPFMENTRDWLDNLKLRLSYGSAGSDLIPYYAWNDLYDINFDALGTITLDNKGYQPNPDLRWETTISRNIGLDFGMLNSRVYGTLELYSNYTKDLLGSIPVNPSKSGGFTKKFENIGQTSNKGVEVSLGASIIRKKDFTLSVNATYNYNKRNIDELAGNVVSDYGTDWNSSSTYPRQEYIFQEGAPIGTIRGYVSEGFYSTNDFNYDQTSGQYSLKEGVPYYSSTFNETGNYPNPFDVVRIEKDEDGNEVGPTTIKNIFPGAVKIKDVSGDGEINGDDMTVLGEIIPRHTGGFGINAFYKGIDMSANFTYALGGKVYNIARLLNTTGRKDYSLGANSLAFVNETYKIYDINADGDLEAVTDPDALDALNADAIYHTPYYENGLVLSTFLEDASYLRLNSLTLGYTLPKKLTNKAAIQRLRVYFTGGNLLTLTGYSGIDPEVSANDSKGAYPTPGLDFGAYPRSRTFTFGVNVDF